MQIATESIILGLILIVIVLSVIWLARKMRRLVTRMEARWEREKKMKKHSVLMYVAILLLLVLLSGCYAQSVKPTRHIQVTTEGSWLLTGTVNDGMYFAFNAKDADWTLPEEATHGRLLIVSRDGSNVIATLYLQYGYQAVGLGDSTFVPTERTVLGSASSGEWLIW